MNAPKPPFWGDLKIIDTAKTRLLFFGCLAAAAAGCGQRAVNDPVPAKAPTPPIQPAKAVPAPAAAPTVSAEPKSSAQTKAAGPSTLEPKAVGKVMVAFARTPVRALPKDQDVSQSFSRWQVRAEFWQRIFLDGFRSSTAEGTAPNAAAEEYLKDYCVRIGESPAPPDAAKLSQQAQMLLETGVNDPHLQLALAAVLHDSQAGSPQSVALLKSLEESLQKGKCSPWISARFHRLKATTANPTDSGEVRLEQMKLMIDELLRVASDPGLTNLHRRMLVYLLKGWGAQFPYDEFQRELSTKLDAAKTIDPWVRDIVLARLESSRAWEARGSGAGNSLNEVQVQGFRSHMLQSRQHALRAWDSKPELPEGAREMLNITMGYRGAADENVRFWFDEAVQADFIYLDAYYGLAWALRPRWGGSLGQMRAFGHECLATERFDTDVPLMFHKLMNDIAEERRVDWGSVLQEPGAYEGYGRLFEALAKNAQDDSTRNLERSRLAAVAYLAGKKSKTRSALSDLGSAADPNGFKLFNLSLDEVRLTLEKRSNARPPYFSGQESSTAAILLPNGKQLILGNEQGELTVWDVANRKQLQQLPKFHEAEIVALQTADNGKLLICASKDGVISFWDVENWKTKESVSIPGVIHALVASPDGARLGISLTAKGKAEVTVFDMATKKPTARLAVPGPVASLSLAADGSRVVYASPLEGKEQLAAWNSADSSVHPRSDNLKGDLTAWQISSDGQRLAAGVVRPDSVLGQRRLTYVLALLSPESGEVLTEIGRLPGRVTSVAMHPDGEQIVASTHDGSLVMWRPGGENKLSCIRTKLGGLTALSMPIATLAIALDGDGQLQAWPMEKSLAGWSIETPLLENSWGGSIRNLSFTPDGKQLIVDNPVNELSLWEFEGGLRSCKRAFRSPRITYGISLFHDQRRALIAEAPDNLVMNRVVDLATGEVLEELPRVASGIVSPAGDYFVLGGYNGNVMLFAAENYHPFSWGTFSAGSKRIKAAFSPDGKILVTSDQGGPLKLWVMPDETGADTKPPVNRLTIPGANQSPHSLTISADKALVAVGQDTVQVFDSDARLRYTLPLRYASFSPDSKRMVAAGGPQNPNVAVICEARSGEVAVQLLGHQVEFTAVTFTPDGRYILTGDNAGDVQAWDAASGQRLRQLP